MLRDSNNDSPVAATPLVQNNYSLVFSIAGKKLGQCSVAGYLILGNVPLLPESDPAYIALLEQLMADRSVESVQMMGVPNCSRFWKFLEEVEKSTRAYIFYKPEQPSHRYYWIELPSSFEEYAKKFNSKERYNLKRELSLLQKQAGIPLELMRVSNADQVATFLANSRSVAEKSWQRHLVGLEVNQSGTRQELLESMARQGILRSYQLKAGGKVCAYAVGFQFGGVFYFYETAYDDLYAKCSPGKCLVNLILHDLFQADPPRIFYFGPGDASYKKWFANRSDDEVTLLILKNTVANRAKVLAHRTFRRCVEMSKAVKSALRKPTTAPGGLGAHSDA